MFAPLNARVPPPRGGDRETDVNAAKRELSLPQVTLLRRRCFFVKGLALPTLMAANCKRWIPLLANIHGGFRRCGDESVTSPGCFCAVM